MPQIVVGRTNALFMMTGPCNRTVRVDQPNQQIIVYQYVVATVGPLMFRPEFIGMDIASIAYDHMV